MKKKFLPLILVLLLSLTSSLALFSNTVLAVENNDSKEEQFIPTPGTLGANVDTYKENSNNAKKNYDVLKAYSDYRSKPSIETAKNLNDTLKASGVEIKDGTITEDPSSIPDGARLTILMAKPITMADIEDASKPIEIPEIEAPDDDMPYHPREHILLLPDVESDEFKETLKLAEEKVKLAKAAYEVAQGDLSSQKKIYEFKKAGDEEQLKIAQTVRRFQDLDRIKKLGCTDGEKVKDADTKASCDQLVGEYNSRCGEIEECNLDTSLPPKNYNAAKASATKAVQKIEQEMQDALKEELMGEKLDVSKILRYRDEEAQSKTLEDLEEGDFIQEDYTKVGIVYFISRIVDSLVLATGSLAVVALIIGGYLLMFSGADEQKREAGKDVLKYTIIGMIFIFSSYAIVSLIMGIFYSV